MKKKSFVVVANKLINFAPPHPLKPTQPFDIIWQISKASIVISNFSSESELNGEASLLVISFRYDVRPIMTES